MTPENHLSHRYANGYSQEAISHNMRLLMDERDFSQTDSLNIALGMAQYDWYFTHNNYDFPEHLK